MNTLIASLTSYRSRVLFTALFAIMAGILFVTRKQSEWDYVFVETARQLLDHEDLYYKANLYTYPPFQCLLSLPVARAPHLVSRLYWFSLNVASLWLLATSVWQLAGFREAFSRAHSKRVWLAIGLGGFTGFPYLLNCFSHQQTDIVIAGLLMYGALALTRGQPYRSAVSLGLAAAMKCTPLLFLPYLVLRRQFGAALVLVIVAVGVNLLPDLISRPPDSSCWLEKWYSLYLAPMFQSSYQPGKWESEVVYNQSLLGSANRWTCTGWSLQDGKVEITSQESTVPSYWLKIAFLTVGAVTALVGFLAMRAPRASTVERGPIAWESGMLFSAMLLFSPMSGPAHFGILILPGMLIWRDILIERRRLLLPAGLYLLAIALASNKDLVGGRVYTLVLWYGLLMATTIVAFVGCAMGRFWPAPLTPSAAASASTG